MRGEFEVKRLVYVSENLIERVSAAETVKEMVAEARKRNVRLNVTGALIFTGHHFFQILEGPHQAVNELMVSICRDPRHQKTNILNDSPLILRRFADWTMAYNGPSPFIGRYLKHLLLSTNEPEQLRATRQLIELASELSGRVK